MSVRCRDAQHQPTSCRWANHPSQRNQTVTTPTRRRNQNHSASNVDDHRPVPGLRNLNLRRQIRVATWNVQTLLRDGYPELLSRELSRYNVTIAGLCETRWKNSGELTIEDHHFIWSGPTDGRGQQGVALALPIRLKASLCSWKPISPRLLTARLHHRHGKLTIIVGYAPTDIAPEALKDDYYDALQAAILAVPPHDITIVLTDANATVSNDARDPTVTPVTGHFYVDPVTNDNGHRMIELCRGTNLCVADTWFPRKHIHAYTWYSNDGVTRKAIDHVLISQRWRSSITNCRVY